VRKILFATLILFMMEANILVANAQQQATGAKSSGNWVKQVATPRNTATTSSSAGISGSHSYVDVTAYGARGDSSTDDTAAITAAITAACDTTIAVNGLAMHPAVAFPPGIYRVAQPQNPSTSPVFSIPCNFLEFRGYSGGGSAQFSAPTSSIVVTRGASPNAAPVFLIQGTNGAKNIRFTDLSVTGYNEAFWLRSTENIWFINAPMTVTGSTGLTDNTPLKITNTIWVWRIQGSNAEASSGTTTPTVIYSNETPLGSETPNDGLIFTSDVIDAGNSEQIIQRVAEPSGVVANMTFDHITLENGTSAFLTATNTSGSAMTVGPMEFSYDEVADGLTTAAFLNLNDSQGIMFGITMNNVMSGPYAIQVLAGHVYDFHVTGCNTVCSDQVVDANGHAIGTGTYTERYGASDHIGDNAFLSNAPTAGLGNEFSANATLSDRWAPSGGQYASVGIDGNFGTLFGLGNSNGFNAGLKQSSIESLDVQFAQTLPPTGFSGRATTGGSLAAATYYAQIWTATNSTCGRNYSAPTLASGVVVGRSNNAINFTWIVPITTPATSSIAGYCLQIQTSAIVPGSEIFNYLFVSGESTTSFAYTGQTQSSGQFAPANTMVSLHRFTPTSLGIGTLNPQFNADIRGSIAGATYNTQTNCSSSASPATCASASAGGVTVAPSATTEVVYTTAITANSQVLLTFDSSLGVRLGVTCNSAAVQGTISARTARTSFTIKLPTAPSTNPACFSYLIVN
jgi:hypothetical protein